MSDIPAPRQAAPAGLWSYAALATALAAAAVWVLAGFVDDSLYVVTGFLGVGAFGLGVKARREARRDGSRRWPALTAIGLGGVIGLSVIGYSIVYGISHLVS